MAGLMEVGKGTRAGIPEAIEVPRYGEKAFWSEGPAGE